MIVNAKEMLKIQKQMEQKEKKIIVKEWGFNRGLIEGVRRGRVEELEGIINILDKFGTDKIPTSSMKRFFEKRLLELKE